MAFKLYEVFGRVDVPIYVKMKEKPKEARHLIRYKAEKDYKYYKCDYCGEEIKIMDNRQEMTGGIDVLPSTLTKTKEIKVALHNKCLKLLLKELEKEKKEQ